METFLDSRVTLHPGDCLEVLPRLDECSVDSVVCDPPYHLTSIVKRFGAENAAPAKSGNSGAYKRASAGFMGKQWDGGDVAFTSELWAAVMRVLKPGGHLVAFSGTRTYHNMAVAIEQAGLEVRDQLAWVYGSGFPKSHNAGDGWGTALKPAWEPICLARKPLIGTVAENVLQHGTGAINIDGCRVEAEKQTGWGGKAAGGDTWNETNSGLTKDGNARPVDGRWPANIIHDGSEEVVAAFPESKDGEAGTRTGVAHVTLHGLGARDTKWGGYGGEGSAARFFYQVKQDDPCHSINFASDAEQRSDLKSERVVSALKNAVALSTPRLVLQSQSYRAPDMSVSERELKIVCESVIEAILNLERRSWLGLEQESITVRLGPAICVATQKPTGITTITISLWRSARSVEAVTFNTIETNAEAGVQVSGKRLFYTAKADSYDRIGSKHPTVKPVDLMQWLVRLVTPKGGLVLDPFAGTGTTGEAAFREGMRAVLIEREAEYQDDIRRRMKLCLAGPDEKRRESLKAGGKTESAESLPLFSS